jgi:hypothetical protein
MSAWRGNSLRSDLARQILADESRDFISSEAVKLELLPKPAYEKRHTETQFTNAILTSPRANLSARN